LQAHEARQVNRQYLFETESGGWKKRFATVMLRAGVIASGMPEMNENVSSGPDQGLERNGAAREAAAAIRSAPGTLLSAAEIWSTNNTVRAQDETPAAAAPESARAYQPQANGTPSEEAVPPLRLRPSEVLARARFFSSLAKRPQQDLPAAVTSTAVVAASAKPEIPRSPPPLAPQKLSLALQGGGSFGAFTWGVLERLLEEGVVFDTMSGASVGAVNAALLACGLVQGGRAGAIKLLAKFWQRMISESSFRSLMLVGGFSPAGSSVAFGPSLRSGQFDPFDLDPLREALSRDIDFAALRNKDCPKLLIGATRVRDGKQEIFDNASITADVLLASTCPPLVHCAVEIDGESYWDGGYGANPPLVRLVRDSLAADVLVVQVTPTHDAYVPITVAAIDRRLDQITANAALNTELAALEWAREKGVSVARIHHIAAENEIDGLAQRNPTDLGRSFIALLHGRGRSAAERWLRATMLAGPALAEPSQLADA
jgi:NTE family protein